MFLATLFCSSLMTQFGWAHEGHGHHTHGATMSAVNLIEPFGGGTAQQRHDSDRSHSRFATIPGIPNTSDRNRAYLNRESRRRTPWQTFKPLNVTARPTSLYHNRLRQQQRRTERRHS